MFWIIIKTELMFGLRTSYYTKHLLSLMFGITEKLTDIYLKIQIIGRFFHKKIGKFNQKWKYLCYNIYTTKKQFAVWLPKPEREVYLMGIEERKKHIIGIILHLLIQASVEQLGEIEVFIKNYIS